MLRAVQLAGHDVQPAALVKAVYYDPGNVLSLITFVSFTVFPLIKYMSFTAERVPNRSMRLMTLVTEINNSRFKLK